MEKRPSRFDRLREEKQKYPFLYGKKAQAPGAPPAAGKKGQTRELSEKTSAAIANVLRLMLNDKTT